MMLPWVPLGDHLEQRGDGLFGDVEVAQLVDHEKPWAGEESHAGVQRPSSAARWQRAARSAAEVK